MLISHRVGAICYVIWGVMQVALGLSHLQQVIEYGLDQAYLGFMAQAHWTLFWEGLFAICVAGFLNWRNSRAGYWFNLVIVSASEIGFIALRAIPGTFPFPISAIGPGLWVLAVIFTTYGFVKNPRTP